MKIRTYIMITVVFAAALAAVSLMPMKKSKVVVNKQPTVTNAAIQTASPISGPAVITGQAVSVSSGSLVLVNTKRVWSGTLPHMVKLAKEKNSTYKVKDNKVTVAEVIVEPLNRMMTDCRNAIGVSGIGVMSGYRTEKYQSQLYNDEVARKGQIYADEYLAKPGHSEHHTGLAIDFANYASDGTMTKFNQCLAYSWIQQHANEYGFVKRYAADKAATTKIQEESWHYRYVGVPHSKYMYENNLCFEEYLKYIRHNTSRTSPLKITTETMKYRVFATKTLDFKRSKKYTYDISGDNINSYIVTAAKEL